ncbi:MAG: ABC transporter permease [Paracoccaceae bacterium]
MFRIEGRRSAFHGALKLAEVIYHASVRSVRKSQGNAVIGLIINIVQSLVMLLVLYAMFSLLGMRGNAIRGDYFLYLMSGIFLFMAHNKTLKAVSKADSSTSSMMLHAPMTTFVAIAAAAIGALYQQFLAMFVILFVYHVAVAPVYIDDPAGAVAMILLAWFSGIAIGLLFYAANPWWPAGVGIISSIYMRANMITSGKMFVANNLPNWQIQLFDWNPLFHAVDQERGFVFLNYFPRTTSVMYPLYFSLACLVIGVMAEFFTRQRASASWSLRG